MTLDIVAPPAPGPAGAAGGRRRPPRRPVTPPSSCRPRPVRPTVSTVPLRGVSGRACAPCASTHRRRGSGGGRPADAADATAPRGDDLAVLSAPQPVDGLATVGVTWRARPDLADDDITHLGAHPRRRRLVARGRTCRTTHEEGPDPAAARAARPRPGTDPVYVGDVDDVQVKASPPTGRAARPDGARRWSTRGPSGPGVGEAGDRHRRRSALPRPRPPADGDDTDAHRRTDAATDRGRRLTAGVVTAKPTIYSRAPVGRRRADARQVLAALRRGARRLRAPHGQRQRLHRGPGARRSSAASTPTTRSRGAGPTSATTSSSTASAGSGRAGTAASTAPSSARTPSATTTTRSRCRRSATSRPPSRRRRMLDAYGRLFAWKLSLHGDRAPATRGSGSPTATFQAINGHRDAGQTACPGQVPLRQDPDDPHAGRRLPEVAADAEPRTGTAGHRLAGSTPAGPRGARQGHQAARSCVRTGGTARRSAPGRRAAPGWTGARPRRPPSATSPATARPTCVARDGTTSGPASTAGNGARRLRRRDQPTTPVRRARPADRRRRLRTATATPTWSAAAATTGKL